MPSKQAGHPVVRIEIDDPIDIAGEMVRWEVATAFAGAVLGIDPFDQPNVEDAKEPNPPRACRRRPAPTAPTATADAATRTAGSASPPTTSTASPLGWRRPSGP